MHIARAQLFHFLYHTVIFVLWGPTPKGGFVTFNSHNEISQQYCIMWRRVHYTDWEWYLCLERLICVTSYFVNYFIVYVIWGIKNDLVGLSTKAQQCVTLISTLHKARAAILNPHKLALLHVSSILLWYNEHGFENINLLHHLIYGSTLRKLTTMTADSR